MTSCIVNGETIAYPGLDSSVIDPPTTLEDVLVIIRSGSGKHASMLESTANKVAAFSGKLPKVLSLGEPK